MWNELKTSQQTKYLCFRLDTHYNKLHDWHWVDSDDVHQVCDEFVFRITFKGGVLEGR